MTQAERLISAIRKAPAGMTWGDMEALRISTCPWARLKESGHRYLRDGERIEHKAGPDGLVRVRVVSGAQQKLGE